MRSPLKEQIDVQNDAFHGSIPPHMRTGLRRVIAAQVLANELRNCKCQVRAVFAAPQLSGWLVLGEQLTIKFCIAQNVFCAVPAESAR